MAEENQELRAAGLKVTVPRLKILQLLESSEIRHLAAEDVYKMLLESGDDVGLATVYRVLTQFETAGLVQRHHFEGGRSVFELTRNELEHHDHIVCVKCGFVEEFFDEMIEKRQHEIAEAKGFEVTEHSHYIYGLCPNCKK
jgi:Fur family transcriptional regulator, ferric uptake regulator